MNEKLKQYENLFAPNGNVDIKTNILSNIHKIVSARDFKKICNKALMCHNIVNIDTKHLSLECFVAEICLFACKLVVEKEKGFSGFSPERWKLCFYQIM